MRLIFGLVLLAGLGLAGFAVHMAQNYIGAYETALKEERAKQAQTIETRKIYVATRALSYGERVTEDAVRLAHWPADALPERYFDAQKPIMDPNGRSRVMMRPVELNEPLTGIKVSAPGVEAGLTARLAKGQRAFAVKVDVASGVSGFLRPGDRVDVYWTGRVRSKHPDLADGEVTKLIQTGVELIAIDQTASVDSTDATIARTVTVAVEPQQVAALAQAQSTGRLSLSLMAAHDDTTAEAIEVDQLSLLGLERAVPEKKVEVRAPEVCTIRTRRGAEVVEIPIPCTN